MIRKHNKTLHKWISISVDKTKTYSIVPCYAKTPIDIYASVNNIDQLYQRSDILSQMVFHESPTACYFLDTPNVVNSKKYFYVDQQNIVKWFMNTNDTDKKVYGEFNNKTYVVASSLSEFLSNIHSDNQKYMNYYMDKFAKLPKLSKLSKLSKSKN